MQVACVQETVQTYYAKLLATKRLVFKTTTVKPYRLYVPGGNVFHLCLLGTPAPTQLSPRETTGYQFVSLSHIMP